MDARQQLLAEALRLSDQERAALAGEPIQSIETEVDADAETAWSPEIRAPLNASTRAMRRPFRGRRRAAASTWQRGEFSQRGRRPHECRTDARPARVHSQSHRKRTDHPRRTSDRGG